MSGHAVAPDSVHVWRGYKTAAKPYADFAKFLGTVFVPACALLQPKAGLSAYVPSMMPQVNKPAGVPDQTALMFWTDQAQHDKAFKTVAVRAYTNLHGDAYDTKLSSAQFPVAFANEVKAETPYYLVKRDADWMVGHVYHFVGGRPQGQTPADFLAGIGKWATDYGRRPAGPIDNALLVAGNDYVAFWEHGGSTGDPYATDIAKLATPCIDRVAENYEPPAGLWDDWPGVDLGVHSCINIQLVRPHR
jgi:hypothetical protein